MLDILDNSNVPQRTAAAKNNPSTIAVGKTENRTDTEELNEGCILEALEKTSKIIQDIESLLAASGKWRSVIRCILQGAVPAMSEEALKYKRDEGWDGSN